MEIEVLGQGLTDRAAALFDKMDVGLKTRIEYKKSIRELIGFISTYGLDQDTFIKFKQYLSERSDIGASHKNRFLVAARALLKEMNRTGVIPYDITHNVKGFKLGRKHKKEGLNDQEVKTLCDAMDQMPPDLDTSRFRAIVSILIFQGFRQEEIVNIDVEDIDFEKATMKVTGKGRDDYEIVHLHPETSMALSKYILRAGIVSGPLFFSVSNKSRGARLTTRHLRRIVTDRLSELGINKSTHGFRHYFTTKLLENFNGNIIKVAEFTRHKSLDMLQVYNDARTTKECLPDYYGAFSGVRVAERGE